MQNIKAGGSKYRYKFTLKQSIMLQFLKNPITEIKIITDRYICFFNYLFENK